MTPRHNGGPPLEDEQNPQLRFMRLHINDWVASTSGLDLEEEALFLRLNLLMYDRGGSIPDDDASNARATRIDVRTYRRLRQRLVELKKLHVDEESKRIFHPRVLREIESAFREHQKRRDAALQREASRRVERTSVEDRTNFGATSREDRTEVGAISGEDRRELIAPEKQKPFENNVCTATTVTTTGPQPSRARAFPKPKPNKKEDISLSPSGDLPPSEFSRGSVRWAVRAYNETASACGLPIATKVTKEREKGVKARLDDFGPDGWERALANVRRSSFLQGRNDRGWVANLDFLIQPLRFPKVHDGSYGNGAHAEAASTPEQRQARDQYIEELDAIAAREGAL